VSSLNVLIQPSSRAFRLEFAVTLTKTVLALPPRFPLGRMLATRRGSERAYRIPGPHRAHGAQRHLGRPSSVDRDFVPGRGAEYLAGDNGVLILGGTVFVTLWLAYKARHRLDHPKTTRLSGRWHRRWQELHRRTTWNRRCTQAIGESYEADQHLYG